MSDDVLSRLRVASDEASASYKAAALACSHMANALIALEAIHVLGPGPSSTAKGAAVSNINAALKLLRGE